MSNESSGFVDVKVTTRKRKSREILRVTIQEPLNLDKLVEATQVLRSATSSPTVDLFDCFIDTGKESKTLVVVIDRPATAEEISLDKTQAHEDLNMLREELKNLQTKIACLEEEVKT